MRTTRTPSTPRLHLGLFESLAIIRDDEARERLQSSEALVLQPSAADGTRWLGASRLRHLNGVVIEVSADTRDDLHLVATLRRTWVDLPILLIGRDRTGRLQRLADSLRVDCFPLDRATSGHAVVEETRRYAVEADAAQARVQEAVLRFAERYGVTHTESLTLALFAAGLRWDVLKRLHQPEPVKGRMKSIYRKSGLHGRDEVLRAILWDVARHAARERGAPQDG